MEYLYGYDMYKESVDHDFQVGDKVLVDGIISGYSYDNVEGWIVDSRYSIVHTNRDENGKCEAYDYFGKCYLIMFIKGGMYEYGIPKKLNVTPYNITKIIEKETPVKTRWYKNGRFE